MQNLIKIQTALRFKDFMSVLTSVSQRFSQFLTDFINPVLTGRLNNRNLRTNVFDSRGLWGSWSWNFYIWRTRKQVLLYLSLIQCLILNRVTPCWRQNWKYLNKTTSVIRSLSIRDMQIGNSSADSRNLVTDYEKQVQQMQTNVWSKSLAKEVIVEKNVKMCYQEITRI